MKKSLITLLSLVPVLSFAYDVEVNGIYYDVDEDAMQATVTYGNYWSDSYSGNIEIPEYIMMDWGTEYRVTSIGEYAFRECRSLTSIKIPSSISYIGRAAFADCHSLTSIVIPSGVSCIESEAFTGCWLLTSIEIQSGVGSIGAYAFSSCSSLTSIVIPASVSALGNGVFSRCSSLTSIVIPSGITKIDDATFEYCSNLTSIEIPSSVNCIGNYAFQECSSLTSIEIPSSVTRVGAKVFANCTNLTDVYYNATQLPGPEYSGETPATDLFDGAGVKSGTLHVPSAVIDDFKKTVPWSSFGKIVPTDAMEVPQCATPTISYKGGKLKLACTTEGAQIHYEISGTDAMSGSFEAGEEEAGEIAVPTYITITANATANGYSSSETVEYQLPINPGIRGDINQDGKVSVADAVEVVNLILEKEGETE